MCCMTHDNNTFCTYTSLKSGQFSDIVQCDGADTASENSCDDSIHSIQVVTSVPRPPRQAVPSATRVLTHIVRNPRVNASTCLPVVAVANVRILLPKLNSFIEKVQNEYIQICFISECWEKQGKKNKHFQARTEEIMQMHGYQYLFCGARPSGKRGGGAAILVDLHYFTVEKVCVNVPSNLEVQWAVIRPKKTVQNVNFNEIILSSFHSAPNSRKHKALLDHLVSTTHSLMSRWPKAAVILGGDKNQLPLATLLQALPRFGQIVTGHTHGVKTIDVIITSCPELYSVLELSAPVLPDNPARAKPSDHKVPVARPLAVTGVAAVNTYEERVCRPLPESGRRDFMKWVHSDIWGTMADEDDPTKLFAEFQKLVQEKVDFLLLEKRIRITKKDKEFITN